MSKPKTRLTRPSVWVASAVSTNSASGELPAVMTISDVMRTLKCAESTARRLDPVLHPTRTAAGVRIYDAAFIHKYAEEHPPEERRPGRPRRPVTP